jgi:hypothetical protein
VESWCREEEEKAAVSNVSREVKWGFTVLVGRVVSLMKSSKVDTLVDRS